ncbi:unnamed protein product [Chrysodeixis includens]|uniref:Uncharacterized protein n=1 Tax=Chrysodeixis includens TaxID=689277 RepID=A0A9N8L2R6_CHRIL|nr:unnamed protein product [Chrysodeixis includens]
MMRTFHHHVLRGGVGSVGSAGSVGSVGSVGSAGSVGARLAMTCTSRVWTESEMSDHSPEILGADVCAASPHHTTRHVGCARAANIVRY